MLLLSILWCTETKVAGLNLETINLLFHVDLTVLCENVLCDSLPFHRVLTAGLTLIIFGFF